MNTMNYLFAAVPGHLDYIAIYIFPYIPGKEASRRNPASQTDAGEIPAVTGFVRKESTGEIVAICFGCCVILFFVRRCRANQALRD